MKRLISELYISNMIISLLLLFRLFDYIPDITFYIYILILLIINMITINEIKKST